MASRDEEIRQVAIGHHHRLAGDFQSWYQDLEKSRFASAFTYGRYQLDQMVDESDRLSRAYAGCRARHARFSARHGETRHGSARR